MIHRADYPCVPFDQCPICLAKHKKQREAFRNSPAESLGQKVEDTFAFLLSRSAPRPEDLAHAPDVQHRFLAQRVAYHLAHGCDTAERARELALAEWDVGVMGEKG